MSRGANITGQVIEERHALCTILTANTKSRPPGIPVLKVKNPPPLSVKIPENSRYENTAYTSPV